MSRKRAILGLAVIVLVASGVAVLRYLADPREAITQFEEVSRIARIRPDYSGAVIPPNIAPLNFSVREPGRLYCVRVSSAQGDSIEVFSRDPAILIPPARWRRLLDRNRGQEFRS